MSVRSPQAEAQPRKRPSPGRNLKVAIPVSFAMGAIAAFALFFGPWGWYPLVAVLVAVATWEVCARLKEAGYYLPEWWLIAGGQVIVWITIWAGVRGAGAAFAIIALLTMMSRLFMQARAADSRRFLTDTSAALFVLTWIPLLGSFAAQISLISTDYAAGRRFIIAFILCVVASDTGGYTAGVLFGKHPMAPAISPKKSWEGFAGSVIGAVVVGTIFTGVFLHLPWWMGSILGVVLAICATLGDLVESQFKRDLGIKDMSQLVPGHGGLMDRLDGMLPASMVTWAVLTVAALL